MLATVDDLGNMDIIINDDDVKELVAVIQCSSQSAPYAGIFT